MLTAHDDTTAFDLPLLRFMQALLDTASITRAGEALGLSQPAASRAMGRLRRCFGDPLLVRTSQGYVLTSTAQSARPSVHRALAAVNEVLQTSVFDPASSRRKVRVAATDYGLWSVLMAAQPALRQTAPFFGMQIDPWSEDTLNRMERGELDCALYVDLPIPSDFHYRRLFSDNYVLVFPAGHPMTSSRQTGSALLREAAAWPAFAFRYPFGREHLTDDVWRELRLPSPFFALESPYFHVGAQAVADGLVAVIPARIADQWAQSHGLQVRHLAARGPAFEYRLIWHDRVHRDPAFVFWRQLVIGAVPDALRPLPSDPTH